MAIRRLSPGERLTKLERKVRSIESLCCQPTITYCDPCSGRTWVEDEKLEDMKGTIKHQERQLLELRRALCHRNCEIENLRKIQHNQARIIRNLRRRHRCGAWCPGCEECGG